MKRYASETKRGPPGESLAITASGVFLRTELGEEERDGALRVLVLFCGTSKSMFAHAVPKKGVDPNGYVTEQIRQDVLWLGHSQVTIRGDNELAFVQVIDAALAALKVSGVLCMRGGIGPVRPTD